MPIHPFVKALVVAIPAGVLANSVGSPLPWVIGPMLGCAAANLLGTGLTCPASARSAGQCVIGAALGLYFTPDVLSQIVRLAPWIVVSIICALVFGLALSWALERFAGASRETAFFAGAMGGATEMAVQGERYGARVEQIVAAHAIRISLVVLMVPVAYRFLHLHGADPYQSGVLAVNFSGFVALAAVTLGTALLLNRVGLPNAWLLGPLAASMALTAFGVHWSAMPAWAMIGAQVVIGASFGVRFTGDFFRRAPKFLSIAALATLIVIMASAAAGAAIGLLADIPMATMVLAISPGGVAEMTLTAKNLDLGVPVVTVFHVSRVLAMVLIVVPMYRLLRNGRG
jgi:membrane AbrB-like protein